MNSYNWHDVCYGREELLSKLQAGYKLSEAGLPQFPILLGMTGIGKTRLAQEVYRWLTRERDPHPADFPEGYWPDCFHDAETKDRVNPAFDDRPRPPIPFLWWGIKFREDRYGADCLHDALQELAPHTIQAIVQRQIKQIHGDWLWKVINFGLSVSGLGTIANVPGWIKDGYDAYKSNQAKAQLDRHHSEKVAESRERLERERIDQILNTLKLFLEGKQTTAPAIPVVLFLDDAQWIDPVTLRMVSELWTLARHQKWPLFVIATHWDDEWEKHRAQTPPNNTPQKLAHFLDCLEPAPRAGIETIPICGVPIPPLQLWIQRTLPGLTVDQQHLLLDKASALGDAGTEGGSPRVLEHLMQWLLDDPADCFVGGHPTAALKSGTVEMIQTKIHDLHDIIEKRFRKLSREVRKALGWSSLQGRRFLAQITTRVADRIEHELDGAAIGAAMTRAESPHRWIERPATATNPGRFNQCDFRSNVFHEIAREHFAHDKSEIAAVDAAVTEVLTEWLISGRLDPPADPELRGEDDLTNEERRDALQMAVARFRPTSGDRRPDDHPHWPLYGQSLARLVQLDRTEFRWERAEETAIEFADARPTGWPLKMLLLRWQIEVTDLLSDMRENARVIRLLSPLAYQCVSGIDSSSNQVKLQTAGLLLERLGNSLLAEGDRAASLDKYRQSLQLFEQIAEQFGDSPQTLRDASVSRIKVGDVELAEGDRVSALGKYRQSLQQFETIVEQFGASPLTLRDVSVSLIKVGEVELAEGDRAGALDKYHQSLQLRKQIMEQFGDSPQTLRDVSVSLIKVGDVELAEGARTAALDVYSQSLQLCEQIVEQFGASPESLRDVSISLVRVGDVELAEGDRAAALDKYCSSLQLFEQIVEQFGASPESLRDVSVSCERLGDVASQSAPPDLELAQHYYRRSLTNWTLIRERYGVQPDTLEGPTYARFQLGMLLLQSDESSGVELLVAAATDLQTMIDNGWATPAAMQKFNTIKGILQQLRGDEPCASG